MVVPQNTPKWSFLVGKPMVVGYQHFRKYRYYVSQDHPGTQNIPLQIANRCFFWMIPCMKHSFFTANILPCFVRLPGCRNPRSTLGFCFSSTLDNYILNRSESSQLLNCKVHQSTTKVDIPNEAQICQSTTGMLWICSCHVTSARRVMTRPLGHRNLASFLSLAMGRNWTHIDTYGHTFFMGDSGYMIVKYIPPAWNEQQYLSIVFF